jgi:hypothetical protein
MTYSVTIRCASSTEMPGERLGNLTAAGPFRMRDLAPAGRGLWTFRLEPVRRDMLLGFGKVAELLVLLAREFEVLTVVRSAGSGLAAAS